MKAPFAVIFCTLALAISASAQLVGITISSPTDPTDLPAGSAGSVSIPITYTVSPDSGTTINSFSVTLGGEAGPNTPFTAGKQSVNFPVPATLTAGTYPMVFTEKYTTTSLFGLSSNSSIATTSINIVIAAATSPTSTPPAPPSSTSAPPPPSSTTTSSSVVSSSQPASSSQPPSSLASSVSSLTHPSASMPSINMSSLGSMSATLNPATLTMTLATTGGPTSNSTAAPTSSAAAQNTPVIIGSVCGFVAILAAGFGYAFLSKTRKNRRKERVFGDGDDTLAIPPPAPFDSPRAVGGVVGAPTAEERPDSWEPEVKHAPGALYSTTTTPPAAAYYNQQQPGYGAYNQQQYAPGYYQQQGYQQNPDIQLQNAQNWAGQYPQHGGYEGYQGQGEYGYR
ncbi:hypothetical protein BC937DRAFT_95688 [Endogone sp. FLAS-F59071]|nr:hypothetical protein BC937DRAFT_95688 [Endogone sp. FLAS-F59071]|eukprot:RUS13196.1 hypothetical protein BC937DRAFT_95688 [Endogone sp. FLAS-F59071]